MPVGGAARLSRRLREVLAAIVEEHIQTARPVGSRTIVEGYGIAASSATVRNDMARLEELGLVMKPHPSAGRIPTDRGYRVYVDNLMKQRGPTQQLAEVIRHMHQRRPSEVEEVLRLTSQLLCRCTRYPAVVVAPKASEPVLEHIQTSWVAGGSVLLLYVTSDGHVEHRLLRTQDSVSPAQLTAVTNILNEMLTGHSVSSLSRLEIEEIRRRMSGIAVPDEVLRLIRHTAVQERRQQVYIEGAIYILEEPEFADVAQLRAVMRAVEEADTMRELFEPAAPEERVWVTIGSEHRCQAFQHCSLVASTYRYSDGSVGTVGVFGPTRLNYSRAVPAVELVGRELGALLSRCFPV